MKLLIITHSGDLTYGAAKSLGYILRNSDLDFDLIHEHYLLKNVSSDEIKQYAGKNMRNSYIFHLPYIGKIVLNEEKLRFWVKFRRFLSDFKNKILYQQDIRKIYGLIEKNKYDLVYLNSLVLFPLITKKYNFIVHVREIYNGTSKHRLQSKLELANQLIFIDESTKHALKDINVPNVVLNNPYDMSGLKNLNRKDLDKIYNVENKTVFSILGSVIPAKGIDYVINEFKENKNQNSILLIVGSGDMEFMDFCVDLAKSDLRIRFVSQKRNIDDIYLISDYIVRGEPLFAIGRTVYEALYSDSEVIMPGDELDIKKMFELDKYKAKIHLYTPRSNELRVVFQKLAEIKVQKTEFSSNIDEYMENFRKVLNRNG